MCGDQTAAAALVLISAQATISEAFQLWQRLDRSIVDEAHLAITASRYRKIMRGMYEQVSYTSRTLVLGSLP